MAIHLQCADDTIGGASAMDDVFSSIGATIGSRNLPTRCSAERETSARGIACELARFSMSPLPKASVITNLMFLCEGDNVLAWQQ